MLSSPRPAAAGGAAPAVPGGPAGGAHRRAAALLQERHARAGGHRHARGAVAAVTSFAARDERTRRDAALVREAIGTLEVRALRSAAVVVLGMIRFLWWS